MKPPHPRSNQVHDFWVDGEYANAIFRSALGDTKGALAALKQTLAWRADYAPAVLSMASVEYQRHRRAEGRKLLLSLLSLPNDTVDLCEIIDEAGSFLIDRREYKDGLSLFRRAVKRFPNAAVLHQGLGCCAGHEGRYDEAVAASERALQLQPENQKCVSDLGWSLLLAGRFDESQEVLERAVAMDPADDLARQNLLMCKEKRQQGPVKRSS